VYYKLYCSENCARYGHRIVKRPTKSKLKKLIEKHDNFCKLGRIFNVSDNAVRKWAKNYGLI
jgi:hypothetical protein